MRACCHSATGSADPVQLLLAVHRFPPNSYGGTELYTLRLAEALARQGHQVRILTYAPSATMTVAAQEDEYAGFPICRLHFHLAATDNPLLEEYDNRRVAVYLREHLRQQRPDLLHVTHLGFLSTSLLAVARELGIPTAVTLTDFWAICPTGLLMRSDGSLCHGPEILGECMRCYAHMGPRGRRYAYLSHLIPNALWKAGATLAGEIGPGRWLRAARCRPAVVRERLLAADALLCPGRFQQEVLALNGYPAVRLHHAPHGIRDPHALQRSAPIAQETVLRFGYIGPLSAHKGAHLPLAAWETLGEPQGMTLTYWGALPDGQPGQGYAQTLLARLRETPDVAHQGPFANDAVRSVLEQMDVLMMPSLCYENTPTVIYEALASGTPVLASDQGGMRELVQEYRGGWLFPRGDARALGEWMRRLAADRREGQQTAASILPVPAFEAHVTQVLDLYARLTRERSD